MEIDRWGVDMFRIGELSNERPLTCVAYTVFSNRELLKTMMIPPKVFITYMMTVEDHYVKENPFHNSLHAADVTQSTNVLLNTPALESVFTPLEITAALFAACVHDVDHPGKEFFHTNYHKTETNFVVCFRSNKSILNQLKLRTGNYV